MPQIATPSILSLGVKQMAFNTRVVAHAMNAHWTWGAFRGPRRTHGCELDRTVDELSRQFCAAPGYIAFILHSPFRCVRICCSSRPTFVRSSGSAPLTPLHRTLDQTCLLQTSSNSYFTNDECVEFCVLQRYQLAACIFPYDGMHPFTTARPKRWGMSERWRIRIGSHHPSTVMLLAVSRPKLRQHSMILAYVACRVCLKRMFETLLDSG